MSVFQILSEHNLGSYYQYAQTPGTSKQGALDSSFEYLDDPDIVESLLSFSEGDISRVNFHLPQIHCSACIWLLEHLHQLHDGVRHVSVHFSKRKAHITFHSPSISLRELVELLDRIGYPAKINLHLMDEKIDKSTVDKQLLYKLGLSGFAFGNIMLLSFPEYLGFQDSSHVFNLGYLNILLATPVLIYAGSEYWRSAWKGIINGRLNIDVPIALGMFTLYFRSVFDILSHHGEGYLDSFAGFVFFLLIGRWFQSFTYNSLDFNRNYKAYFPIAATVKSKADWITKPLQKVIPDDMLLIRNQELIPVDGVLRTGKARIDYSFVTGESELISKSVGDSIFAGGRHNGESIVITATKRVDQSYLTQLWNDDIFSTQSNSETSRLIEIISKYFTVTVISIAILAFIIWMQVSPGKAVEVFTAVLIVACPCALALAIPFTYGNVLRLLSEKGFFLRNVSTIEHLQDIDTIIFDKTGTLTDHTQLKLHFDGRDLTDDQWSLIKSACFHSSHPLSKAIVSHLDRHVTVEIDSYKDVIGQGLIVTVDKHKIRIGSSDFIFGTTIQSRESGVFIELDGSYLGHFLFQHAFRNGAKDMIHDLADQYNLGLLSGDSDRDADRINHLMPDASLILFNKQPNDKLQVIKRLQAQGHKVMMIGDGLNDAGALKQSNVGIVISDEINNFSPACDGILGAHLFASLGNYLAYFRYARKVIYGAFVLAVIYNSVGLYFAITGQLSPVVAAILMPLSSISVILYGVFMSYIGQRSL